MSLIKCAGFDYLTTLAPASALASLGFTNCTIMPGQGRAGGGCAKLGQINLPARLGTFYCGFAILNPSGVTINFNDSTKGTNFSLKFTSAGAITCTPQSSANAVSSPPMPEPILTISPDICQASRRQDKRYSASRLCAPLPCRSI